MGGATPAPSASLGEKRAACAGGEGAHALRRLAYRVAAWSSYSGEYRPERVLEDAPTDQGSRWSSGANDQRQYLVLRLDAPAALIGTVVFGKFHKNHVCNLREFRVHVASVRGDDYAGARWTEVLHAGLRNDASAEAFPLRYPRWDGGLRTAFPANAVRISPSAAWGASFNYSIWHVALGGCAEPAAVAAAGARYDAAVLRASWRVCLSFLRERGVDPATLRLFEADSGVVVEDGLVAQLREAILGRTADLSRAEALLVAAQNEVAVLDDVAQRDVVAVWERLDGPGPSPRGGHHMVWDGRRGVAYLFGGWDGARDLGDLWAFDPRSATWTLLSADARGEGGPGPRSCHKLALLGPRLLLLGRYAERGASADLWAYDVEGHAWTLLCADTGAAGGPPALYDQQMAAAADEDALYVFGGRLAAQPGGDDGLAYAGLHRLCGRSLSWTLVRADERDGACALALPGADAGLSPGLRARVGHAMVLDGRSLLVYAGQRNKDYLSDVVRFDLDLKRVVSLTRDTARVGGPEDGFTQRACLDASRRHVVLYAGMARDRPIGKDSANNSTHSAGETPRNALWIHDIDADEWRRVDSAGDEPPPRFAHQMVRDDAGDAYYVFGGNPGGSAADGAPLRLGDTWRLRLRPRASPGAVLRRLVFALRRQRFVELCAAGARAHAMAFLRADVAAAVDHAVPAEAAAFAALSALLVSLRPGAAAPEAPLDQRRALFDAIVAALPAAMRPPSLSLPDCVSLD